ncbi:MAG TPA: putative sulfate exporter family transporter [Candidatus Nanopelagicales bacterium]|nr:putative sulfate exporter family transporter [Candidatus Nanopelagicales bacterium]
MNERSRPWRGLTGLTGPARLAPVLTRIPGLAVVAAATAAAFGLARLVPSLNPTTVGVVLGALLVNLGLVRAWLVPGVEFAGRQLLRLAVVLLGLQLSVPQLLHLGIGGLTVVLVTVAATFVGTQLLGRALRISSARSLLIATGFSICGASAVAAMEPVARGNRDDTAIAIALVTLCGSLAIFLLPLLQAPLGLDAQAFGSWVGASVHDVGQTVATADRVPGALTAAVVVKLTRVLLLAPLVALVVLADRRRAQPAAAARRPAPVPLFVAGFLVAVVVTSTGLLPAAVTDGAHHLQEVLLTAALVGLGTGIKASLLRRTGGRPLLLGLLSWLLVATVAYGGVRLLGL